MFALFASLRRIGRFASLRRMGGKKFSLRFAFSIFFWAKFIWLIMAKIEAALHDLHKFKKGPSLPMKFQEPPLEQVYADYKPIVTVTVVDVSLLLIIRISS